MSKIVAVIVTYNPDMLDFRAQLEVILAQGVGVVVVDNKSDNHASLMQASQEAAFRDVVLISNPENVGLAKAQNVGLVVAQNMSASHVVLFDQDSIPDAGFFDKLLADEAHLIQRGVPFSAIGPSTYDPDSMTSYPITKYFGPFIRRIQAAGMLPIEATFIIASGCLIRAEILKQVGGMKDDLFIDYIDVEWCLRAKSMGLRCFVSPNARMSHKIGDKRVRFIWRTISAHSPLRRYYLLRNSMYISRLNYIPLSYKLREVALNAARVMVFYFISDDRSRYFKFMSLAMRDGWAKRYGKGKFDF
jgi:rhamnosyltransferase